MDFFQNASRSTEGASANAGNNRKEKIFKRSTTEIVTVPFCSVSHFSGLLKPVWLTSFACAVPFMV